MVPVPASTVVCPGGVFHPGTSRTPRGRRINFVIVTSAAYEELQEVTSQFLGELAKNPGLTNVDTDRKLNKPELSVEVKRDKAADMGVPVETIRNWEQGKRMPRGPARALLAVIAHAPETVFAALARA